MPLPRRHLLAWLAALLAGIFSRQSPVAAAPLPAPTGSSAPDRIHLVDGWLLRRSDLDHLASLKPLRHDP